MNNLLRFLPMASDVSRIDSEEQIRGSSREGPGGDEVGICWFQHVRRRIPIMLVADFLVLFLLRVPVLFVFLFRWRGRGSEHARLEVVDGAQDTRGVGGQAARTWETQTEIWLEHVGKKHSNFWSKTW
ncbi:hypothetical protein AVEN_118265-1 [Araneus ventricosus]|uniref:Transmembrane protein n=1 Tax=Araneus ventricosus TaxID=182803 RepID=A0A4Y2DYA1_ARAVE|nr:hypothetical protein AVEN_118265-1 [Araneus ventricosus]